MESRPIDDGAVKTLATMLADYRLGGCPTGGAAAVQAAVRKAARSCGRSYGELWAEVHRLAYLIIDAEALEGPAISRRSR
jgi:hypothetical protein